MKMERVHAIPAIPEHPLRDLAATLMEHPGTAFRVSDLPAIYADSPANLCAEVAGLMGDGWAVTHRPGDPSRTPESYILVAIAPL